MIIVLIWSLGTLLSLLTFGYLKGRSDARFRDDINITSNPPYEIGMLTSLFWPLQIAIGAGWLLCHASYRVGSGAGLAINSELSRLRKFVSEYQRESDRVFEFLTSRKIDPANIDETTTRALTARSIEWAMEDDAALKREQAGLSVVLQKQRRTEICDILDRAGVEIPLSLLNETKGELDL